MSLHNDKGLKLTLKTYSIDENELLGYKIDGEPSSIKESLIPKETFLVRNGNDIIQVESQEEIEKKDNEELLFLVKIRQGNSIKLFHPPKKNINFQIDEYVNNLDNKLWYIIKYNNSNIQELNDDYFLMEKDIIRIGNLKYKVYEIVLEEEEVEEEKEDDNEYINVNKNSEMVFDSAPEIKNNRKCRFCNCYNVSLCQCSRLVHFTCFQKNLNEKVNSFENIKGTVTTYKIEDFYCKKCMIPYPIKFRIEKRNSTDIFDVFNIDKNNYDNYIMLESLGHKNKGGGYQKTVYLIKLTEDVIKIGKNKDNDIIIDDPSIKEFHAEIKFDKTNKKILLENKSDKPDVAVLIKKPLKMNNKKIHLQCGRTFFEAEIIT
jgi:hypothetical protein